MTVGETKWQRNRQELAEMKLRKEKRVYEHSPLPTVYGTFLIGTAVTKTKTLWEFGVR
jgi:hypothetical protein